MPPLPAGADRLPRNRSSWFTMMRSVCDFFSTLDAVSKVVADWRMLSASTPPRWFSPCHTCEGR